MKSIKHSIDLILRQTFVKQHPLLPEIIINWNKIVGMRFNTKATPWKIGTSIIKKQKTNILHILVENHPLAVEMSFYKEIILERIAIYLGFKAIHDLRIKVYSNN